MVGRQNLALFQHHDGVTGTAKDHVVVDYAERMVESIRKLHYIMAQSSHYLLTSSKPFYKPDLEANYFDLDDFREHHDSLPQQKVIQIESADEPSRVILFNSHARRRTEVVTVKVSIPNLRVYKIHNIDGDDEEELVQCQLTPVFDDQGQILNNEFYFSFLAQLKGMALETYFIQQLKPEEGNNPDLDVGHIRIHHSSVHPFQVTTFDDKIKTSMDIEFMTYGTRPRGDKSGAYLFMPDGEAKPFRVRTPLVRIIEGKLVSFVEVFTPAFTHKVFLRSSPGPDGTGLLITNEVNIKQMNNQELIMRINSGVQSDDLFFTDLNGFQMVRRKRYAKLPLQANYYPIPSMSYIQDETSRLTLISRTPLGGSSLKSGQLEIMMDRRLMQDDNRGLFQGVTDNKVTLHEFALQLERETKGCQDEADDVAASYPSLLAITARHGLINPMDRLIYAGPAHAVSTLSKNYQPMDKDLACDIHIINLRTMIKSVSGLKPADQAALVLHRQGFNGCYKPVGMTCNTNSGKVSLEEIFPELYGDSVKQMSLTLLYEGMGVEKGFTVSIKPMEMYSFLLRR